jgi:hypothetical protein
MHPGLDGRVPRHDAAPGVRRPDKARGRPDPLVREAANEPAKPFAVASSSAVALASSFLAGTSSVTEGACSPVLAARGGKSAAIMKTTRRSAKQPSNAAAATATGASQPLKGSPLVRG